MRNPKFWKALHEVEISVKELLEKPRLRAKQVYDNGHIYPAYPENTKEKSKNQ
jgi:hypothetical protein